MRYLLFVAFALLLPGLAGCKKDATLKSSPVQDFYTLPQGNHPYDDTIVAFHEKYGSYILYKFDSIDYMYDYTGYLPIKAALANEAYVPQAIEFFKSECLNLYPEDFLQKTMPFKIILAAYIDTIYKLQVPYTYVRSISGFMGGKSMMALGWTDSTLQQQSPAQLKILKGYLNRCYFWQALESGALTVPVDFQTISPIYGDVISTLQPALGLIEIPNVNTGRALSPTWDFLCYINVITSHTKAELDATILKPSFDTKGLIRKKYAFLINYYQTNYGVDLQAVGEHP